MYEKSVGAVIFKILKSEPQYLLLRHSQDYWNFPKGLVEKREDELETAKREIEEETGLVEIEFIPGFRARDHYVFRRPSTSLRVKKGGHKNGFTIKDVFFYLVRLPARPTSPASELAGGRAPDGRRPNGGQARAKKGRVKISWEHQGYAWLPYEEAMKRLKYPGARKVLEKAHIFLQKLNP